MCLAQLGLDCAQAPEAYPLTYRESTTSGLVMAMFVYTALSVSDSLIDRFCSFTRLLPDTAQTGHRRVSGARLQPAH